MDQLNKYSEIKNVAIKLLIEYYILSMVVYIRNLKYYLIYRFTFIIL